MKLELPFPDSRLLPNRKAHYMARHRISQEAKKTAWGAALELRDEVGWYPFTLCTVRYIWHPPDARRRDVDNYITACKPYLDGIVTAGLLKDDSSEYIRGPFGEFREPDKSNPRTVIELEG